MNDSAQRIESHLSSLNQEPQPSDSSSSRPSDSTETTSSSETETTATLAPSAPLERGQQEEHVVMPAKENKEEEIADQSLLIVGEEKNWQQIDVSNSVGQSLTNFEEVVAQLSVTKAQLNEKANALSSAREETKDLERKFAALERKFQRLKVDVQSNKKEKNEERKQQVQSPQEAKGLATRHGFLSKP